MNTPVSTNTTCGKNNIRALSSRGVLRTFAASICLFLVSVFSVPSALATLYGAWEATNDINGTPLLTFSHGATFMISGWAVDTATSSNANVQVRVTIDGVTAAQYYVKSNNPVGVYTNGYSSSKTTVPRPDIGTVNGNNYTNVCGWQVYFNTSQLPIDTHTLTVSIGGGPSGWTQYTETYLQHVGTVVVEASTLYGSWDAINVSTNPGNPGSPSTAFSPGQFLNVSGWVVDTKTSTNGNVQVRVMIDGETAAQYYVNSDTPVAGIDTNGYTSSKATDCRPDTGERWGSSYTNASGWRVYFDTSQLAIGTHTLTVFVGGGPSGWLNYSRTILQQPGAVTVTLPEVVGGDVPAMPPLALAGLAVLLLVVGKRFLQSPSPA